MMETFPTLRLEPIAALLVVIIWFFVCWVIVLCRENKYLHMHIDNQQRQTTEMLNDWDKCIDDLGAACKSYRELADKYHELCVAYTRAYEILEDNGLLPVGDSE